MVYSSSNVLLISFPTLSRQVHDWRRSSTQQIGLHHFLSRKRQDQTQDGVLFIQGHAQVQAHWDSRRPGQRRFRSRSRTHRQQVHEQHHLRLRNYPRRSSMKKVTR